MKFFAYIVTLLLVGLATIGDFVIFYAKALSIIALWLIRLIINTPKRIVNALSNGINHFKNKITSSLQKIDTKSRLTKFRFLLSLKSFRRKLRGKKKRLDKNQIKKLKEIEKNSVGVYPKPRHLWIKFKYFIFGFIICIVFVLLPLSTYFFLNSLPSPKQLANRQIPQTSKIYDRNGKILYQIYANENRTLVPLSSIPKDLINATIAIEDKYFYTNPGFDIEGITRAAIANLSGKPIQGGSTITQQLIKSTLLTPERTIERKFKEIILAFWAEKIYTKNQILEMYFNQVAYGGTAWGVESAAQSYFAKSVKNLTLAQSAFLAGMPQAPSDYSPYGENPNLWKKRQRDVLNKMVSLKYITKKEAEEALNELLVFETPQTPIYAPHFVMYVKELLIKKYGLTMVEKGGLIVTTSLDLKTQDMAQEVVRNEVDNNAFLNLTNGAALVTNPKNGDILAMVGSRDYNDPNGGNVNLTTALRQPGSSIKVVTYAAAMNNGLTAATILDDTPVTYRVAGAPDYSPVNYDGAFHGKVPLRIAFANSFNIPAVKTLAKIGIPTMVETAKKMGITTWNDPQNYGLSLTLGAAEVKMTDMATVYGVIANQGQRVDVNPILKITNYNGEVLYQKNGAEKRQVLDSGVAFIIANILADNNARSWAFGSNSLLNIPKHTVSVKTGTTDNKRDNWTIGFTPSYLVSVWVGNNDNSPMNQSLASGITGAAPIWNKIMTNLLGNVNTLSYKMPDNVVQKKCGTKIEYFIKGTEGGINCSQIATPSGMLNQTR
ncbi:MAG: transglycosylase domain-containing protein [Patescibacteria group bacterium]